MNMLFICHLFCRNNKSLSHGMIFGVGHKCTQASAITPLPTPDADNAFEVVSIVERQQLLKTETHLFRVS